MEHFDAGQFLDAGRPLPGDALPGRADDVLPAAQAAADVREAADLSSLEAIIHAAAPCPVPVKEQMIEWFGPIIVEYYAATEGNGFTYLHSEDWLAHKGTVGRAVLGEVLILDEDGNACARPARRERSGSGAPPTSSTSTTPTRPRSHATPTGDHEHGRRRRLPRRGRATSTSPTARPT